MTRVRSAWRARILAEPNRDPNGPGTLERSRGREDADVAEPLRRADGRVHRHAQGRRRDEGRREGSRLLLARAVEADGGRQLEERRHVPGRGRVVRREADKGKFEFVDVPDVQAPDVVEAQPLDGAFPKSSALEDTHVDPGSRRLQRRGDALLRSRGQGQAGAILHDGRRERARVRGGVVASARGEREPVGLAGGRRRAAAPRVRTERRHRRRAIDFNGCLPLARRSPPDSGRRVLRRRRLRARRWIRAVLLEGREGSERGPVQDRAPSAERDEGRARRRDVHRLERAPVGVTIVGPWRRVGDATAISSTRKRCSIERTRRRSPSRRCRVRSTDLFSEPAFAACQTKKGVVIAARVRSRRGGAHARRPRDGDRFGKPQVTDDGDLACGDDGACILTDDAITTCTDDACNSAVLDRKPGAAKSSSTSTARSSARAERGPPPASNG